ncbi:MAG: VWA domain-containing protein [Actinobacteria bacterium]|nr:VWA domain-containing protein [Actinomycetota bacterium]
MTLLSAWALVGLLLALPLLVLHLWRRRPPAREVASLLSWRSVAGRPAGGRSRFARPPLPLLLVLQLLVLGLLVFALAKPQASGGEGPPRRVYVVDESAWMAAREGGRTRIAAARDALRRRLAQLPTGEEVAIVTAGPEPALLFSGPARDGAATLPRLRASAGAADLATGLRLAATLRGASGQPVVLLRAPEDPAPPVRGGRGQLEQAAVGAPLAGVLLEGADASCGPGGSGACEAFVRVRNDGGAPRRVALRIEADGAARTRAVTVPARSSRGVTVAASPGATVRFTLPAGAALAVGGKAIAAVPPRGGERVTLIGERDQALPLARALAAVPGVELRLRTPASYRPSDARGSDLLVLDDFMPKGGLPAAPALLMVDPPRLPGGAVDGELADARLSGEAPRGPLLEGVDLSSLTIGAGAARRLLPPDWLTALAWSPDGPLISAGSDGGQRVAVISFQPAESNLPQLASFPLLVANVVAWSREPKPVAVDPGLAPRPVTEPVDLVAPDPDGASHTDLWPWALAAALLVLAVAIVYELRRGGGGAAGRRLALALQLAALALLAAALVFPALHSEPPPTTLLLDGSRSTAGSGPTQRRWVEAVRECGSSCAAIGFGGRGTDLEAALDLGLATTPDGGRLVLLSDGLQTSGEAAAVVPRARARGITVDAVPLGSPRPDATVTRLRAPAALHAGDPLSLQFTVDSRRPGAATIALRRDGTRIGGERVRLRRGENPYLFSLRAPDVAGSYSYEVTVSLAGDTVAANDSLATTVRIAAPPSVLVAGAAGAPIAATLAADGMRVKTVAPGALPTGAGGYAGTDAVVLEDIPAAALGANRAAALAAAVRTKSTGLLALGGPHSFSLGRYYRSPLQAALPVQSLEPGRLQRRNLALELVLDRSGSMIDEVGGVPKIAMAQAAARGAVRFLSRHSDQLGIVAFDIRPHRLLPLSRVTPGPVAAAIDAKVDGLTPDGGTDIYSALAAGLRELEASRAPHRHIILLSDGISEPGSYRQLLPRLRAAGISVAAIALGDEADVRLLKGIAAATGGNYYATENAHELPRIFAKETRLNARPVRLHGRIGVSAGAPSPVVASLVGASLPPLRGNVVTTLRGGAQADLLGQDRGHPPDPILAQWQYGVGRAVAWTPGLAPSFAGAWADRPRLFQDAARWAERGVAAPALAPVVVPGEPRQLEIDAAGARLGADRIVGTLRTPAGRTRPVSFERIAPGRYLATVPGLRAGVYGYAVAAAGRRASGLLAVPYPAEGMRGPIEATPLGALAAASGGSLLDPADPAALGSWSPSAWWWLALAALLAFLAGTALSLLGTVPRQPWLSFVRDRRTKDNHGPGGRDQGDHGSRPADPFASIGRPEKGGGPT